MHLESVKAAAAAHLGLQRAKNLRSLLRDPWQLLRGRTVHNCPVCSFTGRFFSYGARPRPNAMCPRCGSLDRHRLLHLWAFEESGDRLAGKTVLHIAPEDQLRRRLAGRPGYATADLHKTGVDHRIDICAMPFADRSYDVILCTHVLEHVVDDGKAMGEFHRVLRPAGIAAIMVPLGDRARTYEDPSITAPAERRRHFGQSDHVRIYGQDIFDRLRSAGFAPSTFQVAPQQARQFGIRGKERVILAAKA